jgi:hypothetical protein
MSGMEWPSGITSPIIAAVQAPVIATVEVTSAAGRFRRVVKRGMGLAPFGPGPGSGCRPPCREVQCGFRIAAAKADRVTVRWPGKNAGEPQVIEGLAVDRVHVIKQATAK